MPVTPFHFGPGAAIWSASPKNVSFLSFCAANVLIDTESLYNMVADRPRIHTFLHTYIGSTLAALGIVAAFLLLVRSARLIPLPDLFGWKALGTRQVAIGALLGAWTHVFVDSIMHADITPFAPMSSSNPTYRVITLGWLHSLCIATAVLGAAVATLRNRSRPRA